MPSCELCGGSSGVATWSPVATPLCPICSAGDLRDALLDRGAWIEELTTATDIDLQGNRDRHCTIAGAWDRSPNLEATLHHEGLLEKTKKVFQGELQVGDRVFDERVFIETTTPEPLAVVLADSGVREVLLAILASATQTILFADKVVSIDATGFDASRRRTARVLLGLVLARIDTAGTAAGWSRRGERNPFPRMGRLLSHRTRVRHVHLGHGRLHDLVPLAQLDAQQCIEGYPLQELVLENVAIDAESIAPIGQLYELETLVLRDVPSVTDLGVLGSLKRLRTLVVHGCPITDLGPLREFEALARLELDRHRHQASEIAELRDARPELDVVLA